MEVAAGQHHLEVTGKLKARPVETTAGGLSSFEAQVVTDDLLHRYLARSEDHCTHAGGGTDASALFNGTLRTGDGGDETADDGRTFRAKVK